MPPEKLGAYLRDLERLFAQHGYTAALYGHFGDGVSTAASTSISTTKPGSRITAQFMREAASLVHNYGGSLSGEHGDGQARAELLAIMYGTELVQASASSRRSGTRTTGSIPARRSSRSRSIRTCARPDATSPARLETHFGFPDDHGSFAHATPDASASASAAGGRSAMK